MDLGTPCRKRGPRGGRPSFDIPPSILEELRGLGFTWTCIAKMLNVSRSTINTRVADHGLQDASNFQRKLMQNLIILHKTTFLDMDLLPSVNPTLLGTFDPWDYEFNATE